eukprot:Gregarina_sp_Poly_1__4486@NODE_240_length_10883_cov_144_711446_g211_i0_p4_GENE_NODE_240_length_10883_cov_144_711446_g211_i0NODE_240_length_10883_cov_144_711446_g211_i0_p4_ORF_typecomplete_len346_score58_86TAP42/PF04177_12/1_4e43_NODE_240_length_10883_cov_144_711446_g211_i0928010317
MRSHENDVCSLDSRFWDFFVACLKHSTSTLSKFTFTVPTKTSFRSPSHVLDELQKFEQVILELQLFQRDEILDDIPLASLKFLLLSFLKAQCLESVTDMKERQGALLTAKLQYSLFVHETCWYARERKEFREAQEEFETFAALNYENPERCSLRAEDRRNIVVNRRKSVKELEGKMKSNFSEVYNNENNSEVYDFWVDCLYCAVLDSITSLDLIQQELPLLARFNKSSERPCQNEDVYRLDGQGEVLTKPFIMRISNSAELRKFYASKVFAAGHILPSISLAEAGDYDMKIEVDRLQAAQKKTVKEFDDKSTDSDDDAKELKARQWDDWKDAHPKGSGNTMVNRG